MKNLLSIFSLVIASGICFTACKKEEANPEKYRCTCSIVGGGINTSASQEYESSQTAAQTSCDEYKTTTEDNYSALNPTVECTLTKVE